MKIGGLVKFTLIDFPGRPAAIVFTQGCNFRCRYCHNPELVYPHLFEPSMPEEEVWTFLKRRQGTLEGVVISGGEPTLQEDLVRFMADLKALGYKTKLDTNGTRPEVLRELIDKKLVDYIAMDLKAPFEKYAAVTGVEANSAVLQQSMDLIRQSGLEYQFRTTYDKEVLNDNDIAILNQLTEGKNYIVQECLQVVRKKYTLKVMHEEL